MKLMTDIRPAPLVLLHVALASLPCAVASLPLFGLTQAAAAAGETTDEAPPTTTSETSGSPRRSHIQPVSEMAATSRHADTLGLRLARASDVLRQQLALARGAGLVVEEVAPGSAADKAGFKQHDVLVLLDDQMLLLPEQLSALLEAANGTATPQCTLLRGGAKVTITLGEPQPPSQPSLATPSKLAGQAAIASAPAHARPPLQVVRQTAAKPSTSPRLRAPASALALVQSDRQGQPAPAALHASANVPAATPAQAQGRKMAPADETLVRHDPDFQIKLSRGNETRLVVLDPHGRIIFNDEIDSPEHRGLVPIAVRQRVEEMEKSLENVANGPAAEIGRLDVPPIEIR